jgi:hypothetical protein
MLAASSELLCQGGRPSLVSPHWSRALHSLHPASPPLICPHPPLPPPPPPLYHCTGVWGYWSTDGLGLFEYMLLAEELGTEPVWVINNGVAHGDSERGGVLEVGVGLGRRSMRLCVCVKGGGWGGM